MTVYDNSNKRSQIASVDFDDKSGRAFIRLRHVDDIEEVKEMLAGIGQEFVANTRLDTMPILVTRGNPSKEELFAKLAENDQSSFEKHVPEKTGLLGFLKKNGWKVRGGSSLIGQGMTLVSAFRQADPNEPGKTKPFEAPTGIFAAFNLAANFINILFGSSKQRDENGQKYLSDLIAQEVNHYASQEGSEYKISPNDVYKTAYMTPKEEKEAEKDKGAMGWIRRNAVWFGEVGLRTIGSVAMVLSPGDWKFSNWGNAAKALFSAGPKAAWDIIKTKDKWTFWAGTGMVTGKILALSAKIDDPNEKPKGYLDELRRKVFWIASTVVEFFAQNVVAYDRFAHKKINLTGKPDGVTRDWLAGAGNIILAEPPYLTRAVLPYGRVELDVAESQARLVKALTHIPQERVSTVAARITARMVEHLGDKAPDFSVLYGQVADKLEKYHDIKLTPKPEIVHHHSKTQTPEAAAPDPQVTPDKKFTDSDTFKKIMANIEEDKDLKAPQSVSDLVAKNRDNLKKAHDDLKAKRYQPTSIMDQASRQETGVSARA